MMEVVESNDGSCWSRELEMSELGRELLEQGGVMSERGRVESGAWGRSCRFAYIVELGR